MDAVLEKTYQYIRNGGGAFYEQPRGLIAVWGKEAIQFLDGLITNNVKALNDGEQMLAAFPNAQGRLIAVVRVLRQGDRFLFETEEATREKVFQNLFRFTFAGDFFVEDLSEQYLYFEIFGDKSEPGAIATGFLFTTPLSTGQFVAHAAGSPSNSTQISDDLYETLRIENGIPLYGIDMDETTIVPELGLDGMISYNKGCYIGQEIIARIHFRGHVAKQLTGLILSEPGAIATGFPTGAEITTSEGKNAGRITSITFSPELERTIALGYVRYDHLAEGTKLIANDREIVVHNLPFIK